MWGALAEDWIGLYTVRQTDMMIGLSYQGKVGLFGTYSSDYLCLIMVRVTLFAV